MSEVKPKILITEPMPLIEEEIKILNQYADVKIAESSSEKDLMNIGGDVDVIMVVYAKISDKIIDSAKKLRGIVRYGIGVDNINIKKATERKIPVANVPDYAIDTVADHTMALILALARKILRADEVMRKRNWGKWTSPSEKYRGVDLTEKVMGVIGIGRIGRCVVKRAQAFRMKVIAFDPYVSKSEAERMGVELTTLEDVLTKSDFVTLHVPLTEKTRNLIGERELKMMKKTAFIVNTARGPLVDHNALLKALKSGWIAGTGLDVFPSEPPNLDDPILDCDNVVLTPHVAWYTEEALRRLEMSAVQNAVKILKNEKPKNVVNPEIYEQKVVHSLRRALNPRVEKS